MQGATMGWPGQGASRAMQCGPGGCWTGEVQGRVLWCRAVLGGSCQ